MTESGTSATLSLPKRTLHSSSGVAPASARVVPGCLRRTACVSASQPGTPDKPVLQDLEKTHGVRRYACDASEPAAVELLFAGCCSRPRGADVGRAQHRRPGSRHLSQGDHRSRPGHGVRHTSKLGVQRVLGGSAGSPADAREQTERQRRAKERSSSRTPAQRSKASHRAVPLRWHAMPSPDSRRAWRGN